ncbi:MAG: hypothetical protein LC126_20615 [Bryobacterales bacterium]|nr:hypothetical protein [Bryobacterales bacterium]
MATTSPFWTNMRQASGQAGAPVRESMPLCIMFRMISGWYWPETIEFSLLTATTRPGKGPGIPSFESDAAAWAAAVASKVDITSRRE